MKVKLAGCPLGAKCEEVKTEDGEQVLYRCPWYIMVRGLDPNTGKEIDERQCSITWFPTLSINIANEVRRATAATESFRNVMVEQNTETQNLLARKDQKINFPNEQEIKAIRGQICE